MKANSVGDTHRKLFYEKSDNWLRKWAHQMKIDEISLRWLRPQEDWYQLIDLSFWKKSKGLESPVIRISLA